MLLLLADALLLLFITFSLGDITKTFLSKWLKMSLQPSFIEVFLLGLVSSAVYFNLVSFVVPVNAWVLIPLLMISCLWQYRTQHISLSKIKQWLKDHFAGNQMLVWPVIVLILLYWLVSPYNHDSADYHYHTVYWYENYKVIPGLGNVHGRLAFNAINFIIAAPYSFSHLAGQSLYPVNGVLVLLFYVWLLGQIFQRKHKWSSIVYLVTGILFFRPLLANIPSPASEPMVTITVAVVFFRLLDLIENGQERDASRIIPLILVAFFAITAKLTSIPVLLVPAVWVMFYLRRLPFSFYIKMALCVLLILVPWMARNVVLSGYIVYPFYMIDLVNVDWKMPGDTVVLDYAFGTVGTYGYNLKVFELSNVVDWFPFWLSKHLANHRLIDLGVFALSITSLITWVVAWQKKNVVPALFVLWLCAFAGEMVWFFRAPEFRFGMSYLLMTFCIPLISIFRSRDLRPVAFKRVAGVVLLLSLVNYTIRATVFHPRFNTRGIEWVWLKPMKDKRYNQVFDTATARIENLGYGVQLYHRDSTHDCISITDQPVMMWEVGKIALRGHRLSDGFITVQCDARKNFPVVFVQNW